MCMKIKPMKRRDSDQSPVPDNFPIAKLMSRAGVWVMRFSTLLKWILFGKRAVWI